MSPPNSKHQSIWTRRENEPKNKKQKSIDWSSLLSRLSDRELIRQDQIRKSREKKRTDRKMKFDVQREKKRMKKKYEIVFCTFISVRMYHFVCMYEWTKSLSLSFQSVQCVFISCLTFASLSVFRLSSLQTIFRVIFNAMF